MATAVTTMRPLIAIVASRCAYAVPPSLSRSWACTRSGTTTEVSTPPSSNSYRMLGRVFAVVYALFTRPTPSAAASTIVRSRPVTREIRVATAMVPAVFTMPRPALRPPGPSSSRRAASSSLSPAFRGTGGRVVMTCVSSAAGTHRPRFGEGDPERRTSGDGGTGGSGGAFCTGVANGADGGGVARYGDGGTGGSGGAFCTGVANGADGGGVARYGDGGKGGGVLDTRCSPATRGSSSGAAVTPGSGSADGAPGRPPVRAPRGRPGPRPR